MLKHITFLGVLLRVVLLLYGEYQDRYLDVKYTDIDYKVFTDAAKCVVSGGSPYDRPTYRYTPLLSFMMIPNITHFESFGKIVFVLFDLISAYYIVGLLRLRKINAQKISILSAIWLLNPVIATISTRGSSESVLSALVLSSLYYIEAGYLSIGALIFGISVHFKIYPITYAWPIWFYLDRESKSFFTWKRIRFGIESGSVFLALTYWMYIMYYVTND
jgi:phosphatidylinositol glycan class M